MSNTDNLKKRAALDFGGPRRNAQPEPEKAPATPASRKPPVKIKSTRISADLNPEAYKKLLQLTAGMAERRGSRVTHVEIVRAVLEEVYEDPELAARVEVRLNADTA